MKMSWEWIGGFFEGEGCVTWYEGKKQSAGRGAVITIGQKDLSPLTAIAEFLKREGFAGVRLYWRKPYASKWRGKNMGCWILQISRKSENQWFLQRVIPFLIQKKEKAEMVLSKTLIQRKGILNKSDMQTIMQRWDNGEPIYVVAKGLGIGHRRVAKILREAGKHTGKRWRSSMANASKP